MNTEGRVPKEFIATTIFVVVSVIFIVVPPLNATPVRIILGFPLVLFLPGYSLICALFPKKNQLDAVEKMALSVTLSITIIILVGLALNYTPWRIKTAPFLLALSLTTLALIGLAAVRGEGRKQPSVASSRLPWRPLSLIVLYGFLTHIYVYFRYSGLVADSDVGGITKTIQALQNQGTIFNNYQYSNGFGLQIIVASLSNITGLTIQRVLILPMGFLFIIIAYLLFVELTKSRRIALLSSFLLCLQPDLLFITSRGSHERYTFFLFLVAFFMLIRLSQTSRDDTKFSLYLVLFLLTIFSLTTLNSWIAAVVILLVFLVSAICFLLHKLGKMPSLSYSRIWPAAILCFPLYYLITSYVYPTSGIMQRAILGQWKNALISTNVGLIVPIALALAFVMTISLLFRFQAVKPIGNWILGSFRKMRVRRWFRLLLYGIIALVLLAYIPGVYIFSGSSGVLCFPPKTWLFLTLFNWIIIPLSAVGAINILRARNQYRASSPISYSMLLSLYLSSLLLLLLVLAIFVSRVIEAGTGQNYELRVFPYFMAFAILLASVTISKWLRRLGMGKWQRITKIALIILVVISSANLLLKSTNDPIVSDKWIFYSQGEKIAMDWLESTFVGKATLWAGLDERISVGFDYNSSFDSWGEIRFTNPKDATYYFMSHTIRKRADRSGYPLPYVKNLNRIYDNNKVRLHRRLNK